MPFLNCKRLPLCSRCGNLWIPEDHSLLGKPARVMAKEIKRCGRCKSTAWNSTTEPKPRSKKTTPHKTNRNAPKKASRTHTRGDGRDSRHKDKDLEYAELETAPCDTEEMNLGGVPDNAPPVVISRCRHRLLFCQICRPISEPTHDSVTVT